MREVDEEVPMVEVAVTTVAGVGVGVRNDGDKIMGTVAGIKASDPECLILVETNTTEAARGAETAAEEEEEDVTVTISMVVVLVVEVVVEEEEEDLVAMTVAEVAAMVEGMTVADTGLICPRQGGRRRTPFLEGGSG